MMFCDFKTTSYGKWILAGEHAVLRNHGALVFPIKERTLTLNYQASSPELTATYSGSHGDDIQLLFWSVLGRGQQLLGHSLNTLTGHFHIDCNIPIGEGMGASAALCVAMARWFAAQDFIPAENIALFAKQLEDLFHGKSSGLDIAGVATESGIYFTQQHQKPIQQNWRPQWYLSSCGQVGITAHCINQVNQFWQHDEGKALQIDEQMNEAVNKCQEALALNPIAGLALLKRGMQESAACFKAWNLVSESLAHHMQILSDHGAIAVKPTGSGGGGYVVSLWDKKPTLAEFDFEMIPV